MKTFLAALVITVTSGLAFGGECTEWTEQRGISCIFAGDFAPIYRRQCANPCFFSSYDRHDNRGLNCDMQEVCHFEHPDNFSGDCSEWTAERGITCYDPNSQSWEQKWVRACTTPVVQTWCSREAPNF